MRVCIACERPGEGLVHTCEGSGTFVAAEAHDSGEVEAIAEGYPYWTIALGILLRAPDEQEARKTVAPLVEALLDDALVESIEFSVAGREA